MTLLRYYSRLTLPSTASRDLAHLYGSITGAWANCRLSMRSSRHSI
jgi:hypothetical protein